MQVKIYQPSKSAMQSGRAKTSLWFIEPMLETARRPEPLMGWSSAGDTLTELIGKLKFKTAEEAARFARSKGWEYKVVPTHERKQAISNYLDNFKVKKAN